MTMYPRASRRARLAVVGSALILLAGPATVGAAKAHVELASPIFGLATAPDGSLLVADAEKWNRPTPVHFAPWSAFTVFVTNQQLPREARLKLGADNVKVHSI